MLLYPNEQGKVRETILFALKSFAFIVKLCFLLEYPLIVSFWLLSFTPHSTQYERTEQLSKIRQFSGVYIIPS